jgi:hypothetical protein
MTDYLMSFDNDSRSRLTNDRRVFPISNARHDEVNRRVGKDERLVERDAHESRTELQRAVKVAMEE